MFDVRPLSWSAVALISSGLAVYAIDISSVSTNTPDTVWRMAYGFSAVGFALWRATMRRWLLLASMSVLFSISLARSWVFAINSILGVDTRWVGVVTNLWVAGGAYVLAREMQRWSH